MAVANRKEVEDLVYKVLDALDPSGINTQKYRSYFDSLDDKKFEKAMKEFLKNDNEQFSLDIIEFENDLKYENAEKAAKILNIPLMEYVYFPHLTMDKSRVIATKEKCLVSYINIKRTQQLLHKKNALSTSNDVTSLMTGQVTSDDKNARVNDMEGSMLVALGADKILQEFYGPRADDPVMKRQMNEAIVNKGYVELDDLDNERTNKVTLNTINAYMIGMGLKSNMVTDSYMLPKTLEEITQ